MKTIIIKITIAFFFFAVIPTALFVDAESEYLIKSFSYWGYLDTISKITVEYNKNQYSDDDLNKVNEEIEKILFDIEKNFSISVTPMMGSYKIEESTLMKINRLSGTEKRTTVNQDFLDLIKVAIDVAEATDGGFDPTIGPLTTLWKISELSQYCRTDSLDYNPEYCVVPSEEKINQALEKIDYRLIEIDETAKTVYLPEPGMKLDLGAIAKGFAADKVTEYLIDQGFEFFLISLGGNAYNYGESKINPGKTGTLLTNPFGGKYLIKFLGNSQTIVTSGVYERYIEVGNDIYHHLLNPKTGYPYENNLMSVSIVLNYREGYYASAFADAFATGIYALGLEDGLAYAENRPDMEAVAITKDKKVYATSKLDFEPYNGLTDEFELFVGGEKVDFEPLPTNPTNPENPTDPTDPTRDLLIALIFIVVGFGATVLLVFTLKKPKNKTKEE